LVINLHHRHPFYFAGHGDPKAWAASGGRIFLVRPEFGGIFAAPPSLPELAGHYRLQQRRQFHGFASTVNVYVYEPRHTTFRTKLVTRNGKESIRVPSGKSIDVVPEAVNGFIEVAMSRKGLLTVSGWAADTVHMRVVDQLLLFSGGQVPLAAAAPSEPRVDVAKAHGAGLKRSGYRFVTLDTDPSSVRVFAISGNRASELQRLR
jgi:hypothetical protein